ncbi:hypothetical protein Tco_1531383 [Tanacetum coccineum]
MEYSRYRGDWVDFWESLVKVHAKDTPYLSNGYVYWLSDQTVLSNLVRAEFDSYPLEGVVMFFVELLVLCNSLKQWDKEQSC